MTASPDLVLARAAARDDMEQARREFHRLLDGASRAGLRRRSQGTRWTNQQLLFHMLLGYLITRALLGLTHGFGRLPDGASRVFAGLLNSVRVPFHTVNYLGPVAGALIIRPARMAGVLDRVIAGLTHRLAAEPESALRRGMHYPTTWDPFFTSYMTLADLYRYPTQHFWHHQRQLTLGPVSSAGAGSHPAG